MTPQIPTPQPDPETVRALLHDTQQAYAKLFSLMEGNLREGPTLTTPEILDEVDKQVRQSMEEADARFARLREYILPWPEKRRNYPADLVAEVDKFLSLLEAGLEGLNRQIQHQQTTLDKHRQGTKEALAKLNQKRQGYKNYKQYADSSKLFKKDV